MLATKVLLHARQFGAVTAINPLAELLSAHSIEVVFDYAEFGDDLSIPRVEPSSFGALICGFDHINTDETGKILSKFGDDVFSLGVLDAWKGIGRFWRSGCELRALPKKVSVPDRMLAETMIRRGFPEDRLMVTGHPFLLYLLNLSADNWLQYRESTRKKLNLHRDDIASIFISEPVEIAPGHWKALSELPALDGRPIITDVASSLSKEHKCFFKAHPSEIVSIPVDWISANNLSQIEILAAMDVFIGVGATLLIYAGFVGKKVICLLDDIDGVNISSFNYDVDVWRHVCETYLEQSLSPPDRQKLCGYPSNGNQNIIGEILNNLRLNA